MITSPPVSRYAVVFERPEIHDQHDLVVEEFRYRHGFVVVHNKEKFSRLLEQSRMFQALRVQGIWDAFNGNFYLFRVMEHEFFADLVPVLTEQHGDRSHALSRKVDGFVNKHRTFRHGKSLS